MRISQVNIALRQAGRRRVEKMSKSNEAQLLEHREQIMNTIVRETRMPVKYLTGDVDIENGNVDILV